MTTNRRIPFDQAEALQLIEALVYKVALSPEGPNPEFLPVVKHAMKFLATHMKGGQP
jgi:hypothetical protein